MEFISKEKIVELSNPGVVSRQLLNPENSSSERVTITEVHLEIGACQPRHTHDASEQIWYATKGTGKLLLADEQEKVFTVGDVVRFADKDVHGLLNDGNEEFVYRCQQIKENNCEQSTVLYVIAVQSLKPATLRDTLTASQWSGMWFFSLAFFAVIFMEMLSDFLLVTERRNTWKALNGNVSEAEFHNLQQIVLCENQKVSIEKKLASTILLVLMICATAAFVWLTFWYKVLL